jgi:hypothetical protein
MNHKKLYNFSRIDKNHPKYYEIITLHKKAIEEQKDFYIDPDSGFSVFTAEYLLNRGYCCGSGCRHCPYDSKS